MSHYESVVADLKSKKSEYQEHISNYQKLLKEVDDLLTGIQRHLGSSGGLEGSTKPSGPFSKLSLRKAAYCVLFYSGNPMSTAEIAAKLESGGVTSKAASFNGNVSATLSASATQRGEVETLLEGWQLTDKGKKAVNEWMLSDEQFQAAVADFL